MSKFYTNFSLAVVTLLCSQTYIYTMEPELRVVPSLRDMCVQYISKNVDGVDTLSHLSHMPVELASDIVWKMSAPVIGEYKDVLHSCIEKKELDHTLLSVIACQLSFFKNCLSDQMNTRLFEIKDIMRSLHNGTSDLARFIEFNNRVSNFSSTKFTLPFKQALTDFIELAIKTHEKQTTINKLNELKLVSMSANDVDSTDKQVERLLANKQELLKKLSIQADTCIKEINGLQEYASTISIPSLTHDMAKNGPVSFNLAQQMLIDFLNTDIPDSFDDLCNHYFPEDIFVNGNDRSLCLALAEKSLKLPIDIAAQFPVEEFAKQLPAIIEIKQYPWIEVAYNTNKKDNCTFAGYLKAPDNILTAIINSKHNIFVMCYKENTDVSGKIMLINTKSMLSFCIFVIPVDEVKQIGLNENCTQLGIMFKDDSMLSCMIPSELVSFVPSLKQRAFLAYVQQKSFDVLPMVLPRLDDMKTMALFLKQHIKSISLMTIDKAIRFAIKNKDLIPTPLTEALFGNRIVELTCVIGVTVSFVMVAKKLNLTFEELCDKVIFDEITSEVIAKIADEERLATAHLSVEERQKMIHAFLAQ